jgi:hypothetical protein
MDFLQKYVYGVFELPLPRNDQNVLKKIKKIKVGWWVGVSGIQQIYGGFRLFAFCRPLERTRAPESESGV